MDHLRKQREGNSSQLTTYEDFHPTSDWTHDSNCHVLLVDLPGFKKEDVKVQVDNAWKVTVTGERKLSESKGLRFKEVFDVPKDSDLEKIGGRFDGGLLFVIIPKKATAKMEETRKHPEVQSIPNKATEKIEETKKPESKNLPKKAIEKMEEIFNKPAENQRRDSIRKEEKKEDKPKDNEEGKKDVHGRHEHGRHGKHEHGHDHLHGEMKELKDEKEIISGRVKGLVAEKYDQLHGEMKKEKEKLNEGLKGLIPEKGKEGEKEDWRKKLERMRDKERLEGLVENAKEMISKNKTVIVTAVLAISVGLYITHRLRSSGR